MTFLFNFEYFTVAILLLLGDFIPTSILLLQEKGVVGAQLPNPNPNNNKNIQPNKQTEQIKHC